MDLKDLFKKKTKAEKIQELQQQVEIEKLQAEIREQKLRGQPTGGKKRFLDGWNPDPKHLNFLNIGGETK